MCTCEQERIVIISMSFDFKNRFSPPKQYKKNFVIDWQKYGMSLCIHNFTDTFKKLITNDLKSKYHLTFSECKCIENAGRGLWDNDWRHDTFSHGMNINNL